MKWQKCLVILSILWNAIHSMCSIIFRVLYLYFDKTIQHGVKSLFGCAVHRYMLSFHRNDSFMNEETMSGWSSYDLNWMVVLCSALKGDAMSLEFLVNKRKNIFCRLKAAMHTGKNTSIKSNELIQWECNHLKFLHWVYCVA